MNNNESQVFDSVINDLEEDLINEFSNVEIEEFDTEKLTVKVGFNFNDRMSGSDVLRIRGEYYAAADEWYDVEEITNINDFKKYIREEKVVEKWNDSIDDNEAVILTDEVYSFVISFLDTEVERLTEYYTEKINENLSENDEDEETVDVDTVVEELKALKSYLKVNYISSDFWTEEDLIEEWENIFVR